MTQVEASPFKASIIGALLGSALLLFAGTLITVSPMLPSVADVSDSAEDVFLNGKALGESAFKASRSFLEKASDSFLGQDDVAPFRQLQNATGNATSATTKSGRIVSSVKTTISTAIAAGATVLPVVSTAGFVVGNDVVVELGGANEEIGTVSSFGSITLSKALLHPHPAGSSVAMLLPAPGGSSGFSWGGNGTNSSLNDYLNRTPEEAAAGNGIGSLLQLIFTLCVSCIYKQMVVDKMGKFPDVPPAGPPEGYDDFAFGLCDCMMNPHMCCFICCCPLLRVAHTNEIAGICMGYWASLFSMWCCSACCWCIGGPCWLGIYWRYELKGKMNIKTDFMDCIYACCPCTASCAIGQQGLQVDDAMGFKYTCPCSASEADVPLE